MSTLDTLPINDQVFVKEFVRTRNRTKAYQASHPKAQYHTARVEGCKRLAKPAIHQAVKEELGLDDLKDNLRWCIDEAKKQGDLREYRSANMDLAKLAGHLVDKHEDVTKKSAELTPEQLAEELRKRHLLNTNV